MKPSFVTGWQVISPTFCGCMCAAQFQLAIRDVHVGVVVPTRLLL